MTVVNVEIEAKQHLRILVAEDNLINQKVVLQVLKRLGYRADVVMNGIQVLEALACQNYDVILMDVQMPEMDGIEATRRICLDCKQEKRPKIIALTANAGDSNRNLCLEAGMDEFLTKPLQVELLAQVLSHPFS